MTTTYLFGKGNRSNTMSMQRQAISMIKSFFAKYNALTGKPVFTVKNDKVVVQVFYFLPIDVIDNTSINGLGNALTRCWGRQVELRLIRLNHTILDSSIFAQYLSANSNKYSFNRLFDMLKASLPTTVTEGSVNENTIDTMSHITGVKIKLSGRLVTQRSGPRQTTNANRLGSSAKGKYGTIDFSQHTAKNKLGAFTMKVWVSQQSR
jgi:Mitochondrial ribosomal protein (VAR1)